MLSTRTTICCLMISLILFASKCNGLGYKPPPNCARFECPAYTVVHSQNEFEIRSYTEAQWVLGPPFSSYKEAVNKGYDMLSNYFRGDNRQHKTIDMTSPFLVLVDKSGYRVYFYLPKNSQASPPQPTMDKIGLLTLPVGQQKSVAVRRFEGLFSDDETITMQLDALKKSLKSSPNYQRAAASNSVMVVTYNSPFDLNNHVNEVFIWF